MEKSNDMRWEELLVSGRGLAADQESALLHVVGILSTSPRVSVYACVELSIQLYIVVHV